MFTMKNLFLRALLALSIAIGAPAALAGPIYRVSLDTSSLSGTGFLDLGFNSLEDAGPARATVTNFSGDFLAHSAVLGDAGGSIADGVWLGNGEGANFFDQAVVFGGLFSFDVSFDLLPTQAGVTFAVALMNDALDAYLGADFNLVTIDLTPGLPVDLQVFAPGLADASALAEVPEPAAWMLLAAGLFLIGMTRRLQQR